MTHSLLQHRVRLHVRHASDVVVARRKVRELGAHAGLTDAAIAALATAVTEVGQNLVVHVGSGELVMGVVSSASRRGVVVIACDQGPGIADIAKAMDDGHSTGPGLGLGLSSARRLVDEFEIESTIGVGTTITLKKWG